VLLFKRSFPGPKG